MCQINYVYTCIYVINKPQPTVINGPYNAMRIIAAPRTSTNWITDDPDVNIIPIIHWLCDKHSNNIFPNDFPNSYMSPHIILTIVIMVTIITSSSSSSSNFIIIIAPSKNEILFYVCLKRRQNSTFAHVRISIGLKFAVIFTMKHHCVNQMYVSLLCCRLFW